MQYRLTWKTHVQCCLLSLAVVGVLYSWVNNIIDNFLVQEFMTYPTHSISLNYYIYIIILLVPITMLHEGLHGLAYKIFGGKIRWGLKFIYAYTMEISAKPIEKTKFLVTLLLPLMFISLLSLTIGGCLAGMAFLLNILGSSGDMIMALGLLRYEAGAYIIDRNYGYEVIFKN